MREADIAAHPPLPDRAQNLAESEEYDDLISIYDDIDEHGVRGYEGLDEATNRQPQTSNDYDRLGATQPADTDNSTEHVEMSELGADKDNQDAVSKPY